jgi:uncharacterized pyridoxamine 5'-phosphate oxidase family protein
MAAILAGHIRIAGAYLPESIQAEIVARDGKLTQRPVTYSVDNDGKRYFLFALTDSNKALVTQLPRLESVEFIANKPDVAWVKELNDRLKAVASAKSEGKK